MRAMQKEMGEVIEGVDNFLQAYRKQWLTLYKPQGLEVQEIRLGGLKERLSCCLERLGAYLDGKADAIDELEQELLPHSTIYPD
jgi:hypothetical protein